MRRIFLAFLTSFVAIGVAHAIPVPCNGFAVIIKNNTSNDLSVEKVRLDGANFQPDIDTIKAHSEQAYTVVNSVNGQDMYGYFNLQTPSLKNTKLSFTLKNKGLVCMHDDTGSVSEYKFNYSRGVGNVVYNID